jgi:uncharacterized protein YcbK (DUF882 family)
MDRRKLLRIGSAASLIGLGMVKSVNAQSIDPNHVRFPKDEVPLIPENFLNSLNGNNHEPEVRRVNLYNLHTGESINAVYKEGSKILPDAIDEINYVLRDFRNDQTTKMDLALLDLLDTLARKLDVYSSFNVISGYRSPATNAMLAERSNGVAKNSMHMQGKAIDIRIPGVDLKYLRNVARDVQIGGVGYYASSNFVHVDTGRIRHW